MKINSYGFCMFRRPLLSRDVLENFHAKIASDPSEFESQLRRIFSDPTLLEGLRVASGELYKMTETLLRDEHVSGKEKLLVSLYKFLIRMASRCTPFGLFAGYFTVETGPVTQISFATQSLVKRYSRLDASLLGALKTHILQKPGISAQLLFYPNSSLCRAGENFRFIKRLEDNCQTSFILSQTAMHPALEKLISKAKVGLLPSQLCKLLLDENLSAAGAKSYVKALIGSQILVSSIELNVTGQSYLSRLADTLSILRGTKTITKKINDIQKQLDQNASASQINMCLKSFLKTDHPLESTIQTTLNFQTENAQISQKVLSKLGTQISRIASLTQQAKSPELKDFTRRFTARYGQQPIPLLVALDYDYGIGYGALSRETQPELPLLAGIDHKTFINKSDADHPNDLADKLYQKAFTIASKRIVLSDALLAKQTNGADQGLPTSFYVLGSFHAASQLAMDKGDFLFELKGLSGPSALNLLTRFCTGDPSLSMHAEHIIKTEESQHANVIYAEIAHLPGGKASNIVQRPDLRDFEIVYLAESSKDNTNKISTADLWLSCPDGKNLVLNSAKLNKSIIPVLTTAHNYNAGLPVYRFLCDLSNQQNISLNWDWGQYQKAPFLPRVQYQQLVLSKASWLINHAPENEPNKIAWWKAIEKNLNTPRYFTIGHSDQTLLIDSKNERSLMLLAQMLKKEGHLRITETLEKTGEGLLRYKGEYFSNELVIPFHCTQPLKVSVPQKHILNYNQDKIIRDFTTGSQWLYVKICCAERLSDAVLTTALLPLASSLEKRRFIEKWFFIRYLDPQPHIRLRFYSRKKDFWLIVLKELHGLMGPLLKSGMVKSVHTDTYQRELERYPAKIYHRIESIFHSDSQAVGNCLAELAKDTGLRWQGALLGTDMMMKSLGFDLAGKISLIQTMHRQFSAELDPDGVKRRQMDQNYRAHKQQIIQIMQGQTPSVHHNLCSHFKRRTKLIKHLILHPALSESNAKSRLGSDLIHMFLNRWFDSQQRYQEFTVYHYLNKYYTYEMKSSKI
ncbi:lantibiotic dehydratase [Dyadobacter sp. CY356]|uniref:lantibiotic dehydratase n=1 Tax=Dyadobacter sp. CY356 TaxID=2906442 RepID=UPI001F463464|nr:lantibiotic dehydratase [Dyadobacter sp. CY356]MCF0055110.1 lantibiotic dehydratase [Dyadobacter sp. CY356]